MKPSMILVWHEAGNKLYHDRFRELGKIFDLTVLGPQVFADNKYFDVTESEFTLKLFPSVAPGHWLTYVSFGLLSYIRAHPPQLLYVHEEPHSLTAALVALLKRKSTFVLESSAINLKGNFSGANLLERVVYARADIVFPKNTEVAAMLRARGAKAERIVAPLGNGVSLKSFSPIPKDEARAKLTALFPQSARVFDGRMVAGFAGRIWQPKGLEYFSRAAHQAGTALLLCGPVSDPDVAKAAQQFGGVLLPALNKEQLPLFYSALDLFVLPSVPTPNWREQFGRVCAEAVFCGTPALGSNVGGIPGVVGADAIFEPGDEAGLATRLAALHDPAARATLLAAQIAHINDNFSWASIAARIQRETARF